jgi:hypothetical protein
VSRGVGAAHFWFGAVVSMAGFLLFGCATAEPRPPGVSSRVTFSVLPVYPKSFEITAVGPRSISREQLKEAWQKKAQVVAGDRRFKTAPLVVHDNEAIAYGVYWPMQSRSMTGTITLLD